MGVEELLYLCCYFHMSRMALGDRFAYINQHCGTLFSGLFGLLMGGECGQHGRGKVLFKLQELRSRLYVINRVPWEAKGASVCWECRGLLVLNMSKMPTNWSNASSRGCAHVLPKSAIKGGK